MKYTREVKVGVLAIIALFLLYFGFNYLKGVNIFSSTSSYYGLFAGVNGLTEQAPVYVRGYKVGQVDRIVYDFRKEQAFMVDFSVNRDITLPQGTQLALVADGLLGGTALELQIPLNTDADGILHPGDTLPTITVPGLMESLQQGLVADLSHTLGRLDSVLTVVNEQLEGNHVRSALENVEKITADLTVSSSALKTVMKQDMPVVVSDARDAVADLKVLAANVKDVDLKATVGRVDSAVAQVDKVVQALGSTEGTIGLLLHDTQLYRSLNATVGSADSLLVDLKANPKRYVHFSLFGSKSDKKDKK